MRRAIRRRASRLRPTASRRFHTTTAHRALLPQSRDHHDLASFLAYAQRVGLATDRTVFVGTAYEYRASAALARLGFRLTRTGGASDLGVDLLGHWQLPDTAAPTRVLAQCKALRQGPRPQHVRELEGAFVGAPAGWRDSGVLGVLVATGTATKGVRDALARSVWPLAFICVSLHGKLEQFLWNSAAGDAGLTGLAVSVKYSPMTTVGHEDLSLTWRGIPWEPAQVSSTDMTQSDCSHPSDVATETSHFSCPSEAPTENSHSPDKPSTKACFESQTVLVKYV